MHRIPSLALCITLVQTLSAVVPAQAQPGWVLSHQKISDTEGDFTGILGSDWFGVSIASLGDLDGDGAGDIAVGAALDDDGVGGGAVWVLFLDPDGTVKSHQKISDSQGGFAGILTSSDAFGRGLASLGDLDGDGVGELAVGAPNDDDGGAQRGAVWVLFLNTDGTVKAHQKISSTEGGFNDMLDDGDEFGVSVASLGDLDGNGVGDLVVGVALDDDGGHDRGAVWVLFLNSDGTVKSHQKISDGEGGFTGILDDDDFFGWSVATLGDLDCDGAGDLAVGAVWDDDGGSNHGAVWVLFLNPDGTVKSHQKISSTQGGFTGILNDSDIFGISVASLGDLDGDGVIDLAVGHTGMTTGELPQTLIAVRCGCCSSTRTVMSSPTRRSAICRAPSPGFWMMRICSASRWPRWVISTATAWATWPLVRISTTTEVRTTVRCGCCSSTVSPQTAATARPIATAMITPALRTWRRFWLAGDRPCLVASVSTLTATVLSVPQTWPNCWLAGVRARKACFVVRDSGVLSPEGT